ncbi:MAG: hypothetical protein ACMUIA_02825 [bacterium]
MSVIIWLTLFSWLILWHGLRVCCAEEWSHEEYIQSLPDTSFAIIDQKPDGRLVRLLPHHDAEGNLVLNELLESLNRVFELEPEHRKRAREHLLQDYHEMVGSPD